MVLGPSSRPRREGGGSPSPPAVHKELVGSDRRPRCDRIDVVLGIALFAVPEPTEVGLVPTQGALRVRLGSISAVAHAARYHWWWRS